MLNFSHKKVTFSPSNSFFLSKIITFCTHISEDAIAIIKKNSHKIW